MAIRVAVAQLPRRRPAGTIGGEFRIATRGGVSTVQGLAPPLAPDAAFSGNGAGRGRGKTSGKVPSSWQHRRTIWRSSRSSESAGGGVKPAIQLSTKGARGAR